MPGIQGVVVTTSLTSGMNKTTFRVDLQDGFWIFTSFTDDKSKTDILIYKTYVSKTPGPIKVIQIVGKS